MAEQMRILLVDDETELTEPLTRILRHESYQVDVATDGEAALNMVNMILDSREAYHLVIMDWMLPRLSGLELCQRLRSLGDQTPVLFLTAKDTLDNRVAGLDAGADDYLVKPFELRELLARVRALLRRTVSISTIAATESEHIILRVEDLELDQEKQIACRRGRAIVLSDKEYQLLEYMMKHPYQLLLHEEIYRSLWTGGEQPSSNVLAAHIRLLRRKIEQVDEVPLIHTVYGKGYRLGF
jgi:two-component system, OmpR family, manganese sensing response regulator